MKEGLIFVCVYNDNGTIENPGLKFQDSLLFNYWAIGKFIGYIELSAWLSGEVGNLCCALNVCQLVTQERLKFV